ncbi:Isochorismatase-like protein [Niveomyces insectorum RCEF 264]|uniref:Isochorismatase-like protein n=1 Tax=Niveomyces insectorum RCEF 264 TaxID=1081102 RepID=A0A167WWS5_9HYPO|nr:Isochorismatase-like protein [Niveomyces insectorum RCEF 264]
MAPSVPSFRQVFGIPPSTASVHDSTLVIIDAQNEYADGTQLRVAGIAESRKVVAALLQAYRRGGQAATTSNNIVHVVQDNPAGAPVFARGTALADELAELTPQAGEAVVHKTQPGSFTGTDLQAHLEAAGHKKVVLVGYMAHVCISTTARQAAERGYDVLVVEDAVGTRDIPGVAAAELNRVALAEVADAFGTVVKSSDIIGAAA